MKPAKLQGRASARLAPKCPRNSGWGKVGGDSMSAFAADVADYSRRCTDAGSTRQWARSIGLAAAVGIVRSPNKTCACSDF